MRRCKSHSAQFAQYFSDADAAVRWANNLFILVIELPLYDLLIISIEYAVRRMDYEHPKNVLTVTYKN